MSKERKKKGTESSWAKPCYAETTGSFGNAAAGWSDHHPALSIHVGSQSEPTSSRPAVLLAGGTPPLPLAAKGNKISSNFDFSFHGKKKLLVDAALFSFPQPHFRTPCASPEVLGVKYSPKHHVPFQRGVEAN